jgi:hypothetical protein
VDHFFARSWTTHSLENSVLQDKRSAVSKKSFSYGLACLLFHLFVREKTVSFPNNAPEATTYISPGNLQKVWHEIFAVEVRVLSNENLVKNSLRELKTLSRSYLRFLSCRGG